MIRPITDLEAAWIAGFWDGEGHIGLSSRSGSNKNKNIFTVEVSVSNTKKHVLDWMRVAVGFGNVIPNKDNRQQCKQCWALHLRQNETSEFLTRILPFLKIKNAQAKLVLEYLTYVTNVNLNELSARSVAMCSLIFDELRVLNKRGSGK